MNTTIRVKPAPGLLVRDPRTQRALPPEGRDVPASVYWTRRLRCGDVVIVAPPPAPVVLADLPIPDSSEES